ncbi:MAG: hypothetical protein LQ338_002085 [Usnochroma carphineum]|nr:MAG: hypothetical protein LQ338_002085 [Usnochroma carphineum]
MYKKRYGDIAPTQQRFEALKNHYRKLRDDFRAHPRALLELEAWKNKDENFEYRLLNGNQKSFIPPTLVGKESYNGAIRGKTDTFFSEYEKHNHPDLILSESNHSYIIGNLASYDSRQYPEAPAGKRPEGQGFAHSLVIPKARVYNVVDPAATANGCALLREMQAHFISFWQQHGGKAKLLARAKRAVDDQDAKLLSHGSRPVYETVRDDVFHHYESTKLDFSNLVAPGDFLFGFHVFPDNSIGHLHMHVFPHADGFRAFSTREHDYKTVPLEAILEVEEEDGNGGGGGDA